MAQHYIDSTGQVRRFGNILPPRGLVRSWPVWGTTPDAPLIPRERWPDLIREANNGAESSLDWPLLPPIHDQGQVGQCNADATAMAIEIAREQAGLPYVQLSAADLYGRINGGRDQGSLLEDGLFEAMSRGIGTAATCDTIWQPGMRYATDAERARFKVAKAWLCPTFDHVMSAALCGRPGISGVMWYDNYEPQGPGGWLPPTGMGGGGGHAVAWIPQPCMRKGGMSSGWEFGIPHANSWSLQWGVQGKCVFHELNYRGPVGGWWAVLLTTVEDQDMPAPLAV